MSESLLKDLDKFMSDELLPYSWGRFDRHQKVWILRQIEAEGKDLNKLPDYMKKDLELLRPVAKDRNDA